jgi:urease accessory protein UreH
MSQFDSYAALERSDGAAEIILRKSDGCSRLTHLFQQAPCRVLFPRPAPDDLPLAVLMTTSGGLADGDRLRLDVGVGAGAATLVTTPAAEKVYRSLGPDCRCRTSLAMDWNTPSRRGWLSTAAALSPGSAESCGPAPA